VTATSIERLNGHDRGFDPIALAEAEAIRTRAAAEAEARRIEAEAKAEAERIKAAEEAEKLRLANERAALRFKREQAEQLAKIEEAERQREETARARQAARQQAAQEQQANQAKVAEVEQADDRWRSYALNFYRVCAVVALPVQVSAFYDPRAIWLMAAPLMLEGGAWVVLKGAAAAVANRQPSWHYRLIAWVLAFIAAGINLWHGLQAFDPATALGTAFASIAGPGVWDLHEHGRIRKRDGVPTRRERKAAEKAARAEAAAKAAEEKRRAEEKAATEKAAAEKRRQLAERRASQFPKVWEHAEKLATDLGETEVSEAIWARAKLDVEGAKPGESAEVFRMRNAAEMRVEAARQKKPVSTLSKTTNAQRAIQVKAPGRRSSYKPTPPVRKPGDTPSFHPVARRLHGETKRRLNAAKNISPKTD
jgi:hypothetical protein